MAKRDIVLISIKNAVFEPDVVKCINHDTDWRESRGGDQWRTSRFEPVTDGINVNTSEIIIRDKFMEINKG